MLSFHSVEWKRCLQIKHFYGKNRLFNGSMGAYFKIQLNISLGFKWTYLIIDFKRKFAFDSDSR